jgi:AraC family transcriptional regulator
MAERIAVRHQGILRDLFTPQGTAKLVGGNDNNDGLILEEHLSPPAEFPDTQFLTHMIAIGKGSSCPMFWKEKGRDKSGLVVPGGVCLSTAALQTGIRWSGNLHASVLSIGMPMMERAMPEPFAQRPVELITIRAGERDPVLEHMVGALCALFERCPLSERIAVESLCDATAVYLAQRYGALPLQVNTYKSGLTQARLTRVIDYIETNLGNGLSLMELSNVACLSSYHFGKMFKRSTGLSVHQYVITRRLERAKLLLAARRLPLVEIALAMGFQDQSQFTAVFKRRIGIPPGAYARITSGLKRSF